VLWREQRPARGEVRARRHAAVRAAFVSGDVPRCGRSSTNKPFCGIERCLNVFSCVSRKTFQASETWEVYARIFAPPSGAPPAHNPKAP